MKSSCDKYNIELPLRTIPQLPFHICFCGGKLPAFEACDIRYWMMCQVMWIMLSKVFQSTKFGANNRIEWESNSPQNIWHLFLLHFGLIIVGLTFAGLTKLTELTKLKRAPMLFIGMRLCWSVGYCCPVIQNLNGVW